MPPHPRRDGHVPSAAGLITFYYALCDKRLAELCSLPRPRLEGRVVRWHTGGALLNFATAVAHELGLDERHACTIAVRMGDFQQKPTQGGVVLADAQVDPVPGLLTAPPAPPMKRPPGAVIGDALALRDSRRPRSGTDVALPAPATTGSAEYDATGDGHAQGDQPAEDGCGADDSEDAGSALTMPHGEHTARASP